MQNVLTTSNNVKLTHLGYYHAAGHALRQADMYDE